MVAINQTTQRGAKNSETAEQHLWWLERGVCILCNTATASVLTRTSSCVVAVVVVAVVMICATLLVSALHLGSAVQYETRY